MKKLVVTALLFASLLSSCGSSNQGPVYPSVDYGEITEKVFVKRDTNEQYIDVKIGEYENMVDQKEDFVILYYSPTCSACIAAKSEYLNQYLTEKGIAIYQIEVVSMSDNEAIRLSNISADSIYRPYDENGQGPYTPYMYFFKEGKILVGEPHYSKFNSAIDALVEIVD